jgi:hypothetical protein
VTSNRHTYRLGTKPCVGPILPGDGDGPCKELPDLDGVDIQCQGPAGRAVAKDKVLVNGECQLKCEEEGLKIKEAWKDVQCKEVDGTITFTRNNDPINIEELKNTTLCPGRAPAIHACYHCILTMGHMYRQRRLIALQHIS